MATWIVHMRVASYFMNKFPFLDKSEFVCGSVAPDCGYGKKDSFGEFTPPPKVTHWSPTGKKSDCQYKKFAAQYLEKSKNIREYSFYLGYYIHLLTDILWSASICLPTFEHFCGKREINPEFMKVIKLDWSDLDYRYSKEHPDFEPLQILRAKKEINDYLPYYEKGQLNTQITKIVEYYDTFKGNGDIYRDYKYLTAKNVDNFIKSVCEVILMDITAKNFTKECEAVFA